MICACVYDNVCVWKCVRCIIIRIIRANQLFIICIIFLRPLASLCAGGAGVELNQIGDLATWRGCGRTSELLTGGTGRQGRAEVSTSDKERMEGSHVEGKEHHGLGRQEEGSVGWAGGEDQC